MPFTLTQEKKKQKYLMAILGLVIVFIIFIVWWGFLKGGKEAPISEEVAVSPSFKKVKIDWELLKNPQLDELQLFEEIPPYEDEIGRENPFMSY
jgi:sensor domain CHASE-containing protein